MTDNREYVIVHSHLPLHFAYFWDKSCCVGILKDLQQKMWKESGAAPMEAVPGTKTPKSNKKKEKKAQMNNFIWLIHYQVKTRKMWQENEKEYRCVSEYIQKSCTQQQPK